LRGLNACMVLERWSGADSQPGLWQVLARARLRRAVPAKRGGACVDVRVRSPRADETDRSPMPAAHCQSDGFDLSEPTLRCVARRSVDPTIRQQRPGFFRVAWGLSASTERRQPRLICFEDRGSRPPGFTGAHAPPASNGNRNVSVAQLSRGASPGTARAP
jgi:hypothetical protein